MGFSLEIIIVVHAHLDVLGVIMKKTVMNAQNIIIILKLMMNANHAPLIVQTVIVNILATGVIMAIS
jgi:hypothetical protein